MFSFPNSLRFSHAWNVKCMKRWIDVWANELWYQHHLCSFWGMVFFVLLSFGKRNTMAIQMGGGQKSLCNYICVKLFASNWKTLVFSPPKTGWFIYSQRCSRNSRLMESIQFSIGISGSGQILYHLVGSMNVMPWCTYTLHTHTFAIEHWTLNTTQTTTTIYNYYATIFQRVDKGSINKTRCTF